VDPPAHIAGGGEQPPSVPLPPNVARLTEIRDAVWSVAPSRSSAPLRGVGVGIGIGTGTVEGPARVVRRPEDMGRIVDGDVLVAVATTTAFNAVFPLLSGLVTEQGGLFSHAAILARELGLPAVVGVPGLLDDVADGDLVEVDAAAGTVRVVRPAARH
jgi:pyruvate,water dikinase